MEIPATSEINHRCIGDPTTHLLLRTLESLSSVRRVDMVLAGSKDKQAFVPVHIVRCQSET